MITKKDFAINLPKDDVEAEQYGLPKGSRSELSISKAFPEKLGAKAEFDQILINQEIRKLVDTLEINEEITEHKDQGYYSDSEIMLFLRGLKRIMKKNTKQILKLRATQEASG